MVAIARGHSAPAAPGARPRRAGRRAAAPAAGRRAASAGTRPRARAPAGRRVRRPPRGRGRPAAAACRTASVASPDADAAAVRVERDVRDQPGGQAEALGGGGGSVQDVVAERGRTSGTPRAQQNDRTCRALLGGGVRGALARSADQQPPAAAAAPISTTAVAVRARGTKCGRRRDLDEVGQGEQQVRCGGRGGGQQRVRVEARAQRQADLRRVAPRAARPRRRPHQPQHRQLPSRRASSAAGPGSSRTASAVRAAENATPPCTVTTRGASDSASTAAKPTPNRPTDPASSRFAEARNAASALTPAASSGAPVFATCSSPSSTAIAEPARDTRGPRGVGGVLRQLDAPRVGVSPEPQVLLGVRVFPEPGGRVGPGGEHAGPQRRRTERIARTSAVT